MSDIKPLNWTTKTLALMSWLSLGLQALHMRKPCGDVTWLTAQSVTQAQWTLHSPLKNASIVTWRISCAGCSIWNRKKPPLFSGHYLRNRSTDENTFRYCIRGTRYSISCLWKYVSCVVLYWQPKCYNSFHTVIISVLVAAKILLQRRKQTIKARRQIPLL